MKQIWLFLAMMSLLAGIYGCAEKCDPANTVVIGEQYLSVKYEKLDGTNYLEVWNPLNVTVFVDSTGGKNPAASKYLAPNYTDKIFGKFYYTSSYIDPASKETKWNLLLGRTFTYDYHIKKDTVGEDIFRVKFTLKGDECNYIWKELRYYHAENVKINQTPKFTELTDFVGNEKAEIVIKKDQ
ncbi:MAG: hypothetical protein ACKVTZ_07645 [Bacteroidia bacterium]